MSNAGRIFLDGGNPKDDNGSRVNLGLSFTSEHDLDRHLWINPDDAGKDIAFLLKVHQGEMSPALHRIALKAITLPLFIREFQGDATSPDIEEAVRGIPDRNSRLLDAYMDRLGETSIDQTMLKQAIDDTTVLQLVSRSLREDMQNDIILLPAGPEEDHLDLPTSFTVLRRKSLGRALLFVSGVRPVAHTYTPEVNRHRIHIRPVDLLSGGATRYDLAEALITDQGSNTSSAKDNNLIMTAESHIRDKINHHFDRIQPQS